MIIQIQKFDPNSRSSMMDYTGQNLEFRSLAGGLEFQVD